MGLGEALKPFIDNPDEYLFLYVFISVIVWLYININNRIQKIELRKDDHNNIILSKYSELLFILKSLENNSLEDIPLEVKDNINKIISDVIPYTTKKFTQYLIDWREKNRKEVIDELEEKIRILKLNQKVYRLNNDLDLFSLIREVLFISGFKSFLKSLLLIIIISIGLLIFIATMLKVKEAGIIKAFLLSSRPLFHFFGLLVVLKIFNSYIVTKKLKLKNRNWTKLFGLVILISIGSTVLFEIIGSGWVYVGGLITYCIFSIYISDFTAKNKP
ncbi:hypothetical protein [Natroniella sp. ANB-PHB2]|uniref:hypothetical protein n=1 Tax=Natroniella sp. ANB-PHB2 TaxID=3384444 RepID=UPI0038D47649